MYDIENATTGTPMAKPGAPLYTCDHAGTDYACPECVAKPLLIGENNPYGGDSKYALYPAPEGCSGHRLAVLILGMRRQAYLDAFVRVNLVEGRWSMKLARKRAAMLITSPRKMILCGRRVCDTFGVPFRPFATFPNVFAQTTVRNKMAEQLVIPHPSGRNLLWNDADVIAKCRMAVIAFYPEASALIGAAED